MAELRTLPSLYRTHGVAGLQEALDLAYIEVSQQRTSHQEMMLLHAYKKLLSNTAGLVQAVLTAYIGIYRLTSGLDDLLPLESVMAWSHLFELAEDQKMQDGTYNEVKQGMVAALTDLSAADFLDNCVRFGLAAPLIWSPPIPPKLSVKGNESLRGLERLGETVRSQYISKVAEKLIMTVRNEDRGTLVRFAGSEDLFERLWEVSRPELIPGELEDVRPQHSPKSPQSCTRRFVRWNRPRELIKEVRSLPVADRTSIGRLLLKTVLLQLQTVFCMSIVEGIVFYCLRRSSTSKASIRKEALAMSFGLWSDAIITSCCSDEKSDNERWGCLSILDWTHTLGRTEAVNDFRPTSVEQAIEDAILALRTAMTEALSVLELVKELPWASRVETDWRDLMKCLSHLERQQLSSFPKEVHAYTSMNRRLTFHERGCQECLEEECPVLLSLVIEADEGLKRAFRDYWTRRETIKAEERWVLDSAENSKDLPQPPTPSCGEQPPIPSASEKELALFKWHGSGLRPQLTTCTPACKPARSAPAQLNIGTLVIQSNA
ncbi:MAG: uncharacterized protein KVP18_000485 [Porospora cf. gigantea A]|nr:MAG: hypothetical protein KVP18_000485 [Porospora cf. gigantea A]